MMTEYGPGLIFKIFIVIITTSSLALHCRQNLQEWTGKLKQQQQQCICSHHYHSWNYSGMFLFFPLRVWAPRHELKTMERTELNGRAKPRKIFGAFAIPFLEKTPTGDNCRINNDDGDVDDHDEDVSTHDNHYCGDDVDVGFLWVWRNQGRPLPFWKVISKPNSTTCSFLKMVAFNLEKFKLWFFSFQRASSIQARRMTH